MARGRHLSNQSPGSGRGGGRGGGGARGGRGGGGRGRGRGGVWTAMTGVAFNYEAVNGAGESLSWSDRLDGPLVCFLSGADVRLCRRRCRPALATDLFVALSSHRPVYHPVRSWYSGNAFIIPRTRRISRSREGWTSSAYALLHERWQTGRGNCSERVSSGTGRRGHRLRLSIQQIGICFWVGCSHSPFRDRGWEGALGGSTRVRTERPQPPQAHHLRQGWYSLPGRPGRRHCAVTRRSLYVP